MAGEEFTATMDDLKVRISRACHPENMKLAMEEAQRFASDHARVLVYGLLAIVTVIWAIATATRRFTARKQQTPSRPRTPDIEKPHSIADTPKSKFAMAQPGGMSSPILLP